jgi:hypothetical protein
MKRVELRCSKLPLLFACPSSHGGDYDLGGTSRPAQLGTAVHADVDAMWKGEELPETDDEERLELREKGAQVVADLKTMADDWVSESHMYDQGDGWRLSGTCDLVSADKRLIVDHKTGWKDNVDLSAQVAGYCMLAGDIDETWTGVFAWYRRGNYETQKYTADDLLAFRDKITELVGKIGKTYNPGLHCNELYCPNRSWCRAKRSNDETAMSLIKEDLGAIALPEQVARLYEARKAMEKLCEKASDFVKDYIATNGPITMPDGRELVLAERGKTTIDPQAGWETMAEVLPVDDIAQSMKVNKGKLDKAVKALAPKGTTKNLDDFYAKLSAAGALSRTSTPTLQVQKKEKKDA